MMSLPQYQCPICHTSMSIIDKSLTCANNHQFDYAKEGYVHLLPVQLKKSLNPGDDKNMVLARRKFLQLGHYEFLREALLKTLSEKCNSVIIDLGCGEGYYTNYIETELSNSQVYGVDISKDAVKYASKRNKQVHYSVATNAHTPFASSYANVILNVFAPLVGQECHRILAKDGYILSANPGPNHLFELKQVIYNTPEHHQPPTPPEGFQTSIEHTIEKTISLEQASDIENLLKMTPFGWKITKDKKQKLLLELPFTVTLSFVISEFIPNV